MALRKEIKVGNKINLKEVESGFAREYKIEKVLGKGNTCIVYEVSYEKDSSIRKGVLKELYPKDCKIVREEKILHCDKDSVTSFNDEKKYFRHAYDSLVLLDNEESIRNYIVSPISYLSNIEITEEKGTYYILSERVTGDILANYRGKLSLKEIFELALSLSNALEKLHKLGRLYLDLKPENIFITPPKEGISVRLFDVDTMIEKSELKRAIKEKSSIRLGVSPDWLSPEQEEISIKGLNEETIKKINEKTDYYQLGLLIKDLLEDAIDGTDSFGENLFIVDKNSYIFKDINPSVFNKIESFFERILARNQRDRYLNIESLKSAIKEIISISDENIAFIKHTPFYSKEKFIGRKSEIEAIDKYFEKEEDSSTVVYLEGIGGIGKSELAKRYAKIREEYYNRVFYISYETNLKYSLVGGLSIPGINITGGDIEDVYKVWYSKAIELIDSQMLLVIDNMNEEDEDIKEVFKLGCKVLISTRKTHNKEDNNLVEVNELKQEYVLELFKVESKLEEEEYNKNKETIQNILEVFNSHTMAVEIAARQLLDLGYTVEEYYEVLKEGISKLETEVSIKKDGVNKNKEPIEHFRLLFKISELSAKEIELLKILAVVPRDGINKRKLFDYLKLDKKQEMGTEKLIKSLSSKSVIYKDGRGRNISLRLHPLIKELILKDHTPSLVDDYQKRYQGSFIKIFGNAKTYEEVKDDIGILRAYSKVITRLKEDSKYNDIYRFLGEHLKEYSYYDDALNMRKLALFCSIKFNGEKHETTAVAYGNLASIYYDNGYNEKALEYNEKSLEINLSIYGEKHPDVATACNMIGSIYSNKGYYKKSLKYNKKALEIRRKLYVENHPDIASSYNSIAFIYSKEGNDDKALYYLEKSLEIYLEVYGGDHPNVANLYNNIGYTYSSKGDYEKALEYFNKSLKIYLDAYGERNTDVATVYNNIGALYLNKKDYKKTLEYQEKALDIRLKIYGEKHIDVAGSYNNIGSLYSRKGDYKKALKYNKKSLKIFLEIYGEEHPNLVTLYSNIASVYHNTCEYEKSLKCYKKALGISIRIYGEKDPKVGSRYKYIAMAYKKIGNTEKAYEYYKKAKQCKEEKSEDNAPVESEISNIDNNKVNQDVFFDKVINYIKTMFD